MNQPFRFPFTLGHGLVAGLAGYMIAPERKGMWFLIPTLIGGAGSLYNVVSVNAYMGQMTAEGGVYATPG